MTDQKTEETNTPNYAGLPADARKLLGLTFGRAPYCFASAVGEVVDNSINKNTRSESVVVTVIEDDDRSKGGGSSFASEIWVADIGSGMDTSRLIDSNTLGSNTYVPADVEPDDFNLSAYGIGGTAASAWYGRTKITLTKEANGSLLKSVLQLDNRPDFPDDVPIPLDKVTTLPPPASGDEELWREQINLCYPDGAPAIQSNLMQGTFIVIKDFHSWREESIRALPLVKKLTRYISETYVAPLKAGKTIGVRRLKRNTDGTYETKGGIQWCEPADVTYADTYKGANDKGALRRPPEVFVEKCPLGSGGNVTLTFTHLTRKGYQEVNEKRGLHKDNMSATACASIERCQRQITSGFFLSTLFPSAGGVHDRLRCKIAFDDPDLDGHFGISPYKNDAQIPPATVKWLKELACVKHHKKIAREDMSSDRKNTDEPPEGLQELANGVAANINDAPRSFDMSKRQPTPSENGRGPDKQKRKPKTNVGVGSNNVYRKVSYKVEARPPSATYAWLEFDEESSDPVIGINSEAPVLKDLFDSDLSDDQKTLVMDLLAAPLLAEIKLSDEDAYLSLLSDLRNDTTKYLKNLAAQKK
jgi:hypothetical protein